MRKRHIRIRVGYDVDLPRTSRGQGESHKYPLVDVRAKLKSVGRKVVGASAAEFLANDMGGN